MAGKFGCCTGGTNFGKTNIGKPEVFGRPNVFGKPNIGSPDINSLDNFGNPNIGSPDFFGGGQSSRRGGGGGGDDVNYLCAGGSEDTTSFIDPQGKPQDKWPNWAGGEGCAYLSLIASNQKKYGKKGRLIYSPGNFKKLAECFKRCGGKGTVAQFKQPTLRRDNNPHNKKTIECWKKCKIELLHGYGIDVKPVFYSWGTGGIGIPGISGDLTPVYPPPPRTLCPPLCMGTEVIVIINMMVTVVDPNTGDWGAKIMTHIISGKTVCCTTSKKICFDLEDYPPQIPSMGRICVGQSGQFIPIPAKDLPMGGKNYAPIGDGFPIHEEGYCQKCMADPKCRASLGGKKCYSMVTTSSWIVGIYTESTVTACPQGPGLYVPCK